jgi:hypothetical protein
MTLTDFTKRMKKIGAPTRARTTNRNTKKPIEVIDDVVNIGTVGTEWDRVERNGRMYLTRKE